MEQPASPPLDPWFSRKIKTLEELAQLAGDYRTREQKIVYAHGTFDLLHLGHVRHFNAAKGKGDVLMVGITADKFVNKGPDRPYFPQHLRAEMIAAIENVDYVAIIDSLSSLEALDAIKPHFYVKGSDYVNPADDVTGKIVLEREAVERNGGSIHFTEEITFSSSSLINEHLDVFDPPLREFLQMQKAENAKEDILGLLEIVKDYKVLLIGDVIIDEYRFTSPLGKSPKENIIATQFQDAEVYAGGVIAAANHMAGFCKEVQVLSSLGEIDSYKDFIHQHLKPNVKFWAVDQPGKPTTRKCRYVDRSYMRKLFEVYYMDDEPLSTAHETQFIERIHEAAQDADLVIVTDFGHGLMTRAVIESLTNESCFLAVNAQTNSANTGFNLITRYTGANFICIDAPEAHLAVGDKNVDLDRMARELLPGMMNSENLIITAGRHGCVTYNSAQGLTRIPALTKSVVDTVGAGDAFFVVAAPLVAAGGRMDRVGLVGNVAGAIKVGILGHRQSVEKVSVIKYLETLLK